MPPRRFDAINTGHAAWYARCVRERRQARGARAVVEEEYAAVSAERFMTRMSVLPAASLHLPPTQEREEDYFFFRFAIRY